MAGKGAMTRTDSRQMYARIEASKAANLQAIRAADLHRLTCPIELAKTFLRQRGFHVFAENVLIPRSDLIVVGRTPMPANDVIAMAERIRSRA